MNSNAPKKSSIYTRTGDGGVTGLLGGMRVPKHSDIVEAIGDVDELNSFVGQARERATAAASSSSALNKISHLLEVIQARIFDVGAAIAVQPWVSDEQHKHRFSPDHAKSLEGSIDELEVGLPPLKNFILPSGGEAACALHVCRAVCRRAERRVCTLIASERADPELQIYLNRLSDFFFVAARYCAHAQGNREVGWKAHAIVKS